MNKKIVSALLCGAMILGSAVPAMAGSADGKKIALVGKSAGNAFFEIAAKSFVETAEAEGATVDTVYPEAATADAQIKVLDNLISQDYDAICISANDVNALQAKLQEAMDEGIKISCFDSATNPDSRQIFINQAGTVAVGQALLDACLDISGGEGQFAILSATSQAANQNAWIDAMKTIMEGDDKYSKLELVDVVYGDDESQKSYNEALGLLKTYPDLKGIISPTTVGIAAVCKAVEDEGLTGKVYVSGIGLPSLQAEYIKNGTCDTAYIWNPIDLGYLSAYTTKALLDGEISGAIGDTFSAGRLGDFTVTDDGANGSEVVLGPPLELNSENIDDFKNIF